MVVLAGLVFLPRWAIAAIGLIMIAGHNLLDGVRAEDFGAAGWIWNFLHQPGLLQVGPDFRVCPLSADPLGRGHGGRLCAGAAVQARPDVRRRWLIDWAPPLPPHSSCCVPAISMAIRRRGRTGQRLATVLSFINCEKYPPSLLYLMMTLGPALVLLALFERARGTLAGWIITFGRVPFLYYVVHIVLIHALAVVMAWAVSATPAGSSAGRPPQKPAGYGLGLPGIYAVWLLVVVALYPLCRWFAALKQRRREWWWSYL